DHRRHPDDPGFQEPDAGARNVIGLPAGKTPPRGRRTGPRVKTADGFGKSAMAKKKRGAGHGGGHGWYVSFADLMGLMMSFFVMLVAFSTMDNKKLKIVAGSMREAFGGQTGGRHSGIIES